MSGQSPSGLDGPNDSLCETKRVDRGRRGPGHSPEGRDGVRRESRVGNREVGCRKGN